MVGPRMPNYGDPGNAHGVLRVDSETAAAMVTRSALRLLGEAAAARDRAHAGAHAVRLAHGMPAR